MKRGRLKTGLGNMGSKLKNGVTYLSKGGMKRLFSHIDQLAIQKEVELHGLDRFVNKCALLGAGSGIVTGAGGLATMAIGIPLDIVNLLAQQFRVTIAVTYANTGSCKLQFDDFIKIVATTLKVDTTMAVTKNIMEEVAEKLLVNIGSKTAERLIPIVGAAIGGSVNYLFIRRMAKLASAQYVKAAK